MNQCQECGKLFRDQSLLPGIVEIDDKNNINRLLVCNRCLLVMGFEAGEDKKTKLKQHIREPLSA